MSANDATQPSFTTAQFAQVDEYLEDTLIRPDAEYARTRQAGEDAGLPTIDVSAAQGKMLHLLVQISGARRILEVGTLAGYSTLWMAKALDDEGRVVTCEFDSFHAEVARRNLEEEGVGHRVEIRVGAAEETLRGLIETGTEPFDFIFLDADKGRLDTYLELSLKLSRAGTVIVGDNIVREGTVLTDQADPEAAGIRRFLSAQADHPDVQATAIQTVGAKPWDGFSLAVVQ